MKRRPHGNLRTELEAVPVLETVFGPELVGQSPDRYDLPLRTESFKGDLIG